VNSQLTVQTMLTMMATGKNIMRASPNFHVVRGRGPAQEPSAVTHGGHVAQGAPPPRTMLMIVAT
jgi:hypothetical protein